MINLAIEKGTQKDIDELELLYDYLNIYLADHINYPGWKKGIYPARETAVDGVDEGNLFVARTAEGKIVGTMILRHKPETAYALADWHTELDYNDIIVIYTLAVHSDYLHNDIGKMLMEFIISYAKKTKMKAIRLDVYEDNIPAIRLYENFGFEYIDTVDLGYSQYGLEQFRLYQLIL